MSAEKPPTGLMGPWRAVWSEARTEIVRLGAWSKPRRRLLDSYVFALRDAAHLAELARAAPVSQSKESGLPSAHSAWAAADRERKAAIALAGELGLTARAAKLLDGKLEDNGEGAADPYRALDDELAPRRKRRAS